MAKPALHRGLVPALLATSALTLASCSTPNSEPEATATPSDDGGLVHQ